MLSKSKKTKFNEICGLYWLVNMQKTLSSLDPKNKEKYENWVEYEKEIRPFKQNRVVSNSPIYSQFKEYFELGTKMKEVFNKKKNKSSRVKMKDFDKV